MRPTTKARNIWGKRTITLEDTKSQVGPGWGKLIEKIWDKLPYSALIEQVKEKFGTLRFYVAYVDKETLDFIDVVEHESGTVCEQCGEPGKVRADLSWILTLCDKHYQETWEYKHRAISLAPKTVTNIEVGQSNAQEKGG